jgi:hypothetical protein
MTGHRPVKTEHHLAKALHPTPRVLKEAMGEAEGFNAKFAVLITRLVGTMWCAYLFAIIALLGLGPALKPGDDARRERLSRLHRPIRRPHNPPPWDLFEPRSAEPTLVKDIHAAVEAHLSSQRAAGRSRISLSR